MWGLDVYEAESGIVKTVVPTCEPTFVVSVTVFPTPFVAPPTVSVRPVTVPPRVLPRPETGGEY